MQILHGLAILLFYLLTFTFAGSLFPVKIQKNRLANQVLLGFFAYFSLFEVIALPMKIKKLRFHVLSRTWAAVVIVIWLCALLLRRSSLKEAFRDAAKSLKEHPWCRAGFAAAAALAILLGVNVNAISSFDAGYYLGLPTSSVYSDTIERVNPYTGKRKKTYNEFYFLNTNTIHSGITYKNLKLHPLVEEKFTFTMTLTLLFCLILYRIAMYLFHEDRKKAVLCMILSLLVLMFSYSLSGVSQYFAYRTYEGKSVCAFLYMAAVFLFFLAVYFEKDSGWGWSGLLFASLSSAVFCNTAVYLVPALTGILFLPDFLRIKLWKKRWLLLPVLLPSVFWIIVCYIHG